MKLKVSISMDEDTLARVKERARGSAFRNQSHLIEHAVIRFLEEKDE